MDTTKRQMKTLAGLLIALVLFSGVVVASGNIVDNPGFETGDFSGWSADDSFTVNQNNVSSGSYSVTFEGGGSDDKYMSQSLPSNTENTSSVDFYAESFSGDYPFKYQIYDGQQRIIGIRVTGNGDIEVDEDGSITTTSISINTDTYYRFKLNEIDYSAETYTLEIINLETGNTVATRETGFLFSGSSMDKLEFGAEQDKIHIDNARVYSSFELHTVSGKVTDENEQKVKAVTITAKDSSGATVATDTTDKVGEYSLNLENGTYNITASKDGYISDTQTVTVDGNDISDVNLQITETDQSITFDTRAYMDHGTEYPYRVTIENKTGRYNVSKQANITSRDTEVVTVDKSNLLLKATNNTSINRRVTVTANFTDSSGNTFNAKQNVTVANKTVENIAILPTGARFGASMGDQAIQVILVATILGAATALIGRVFAGIGAMSIIFVLGWFGGFIGDGLVIISFLFAAFIGLNIAGNIDYTVRR